MILKDKFEKAMYRYALKKKKGEIMETSRLVGVSQKTVYSKLEKYPELLDHCTVQTRDTVMRKIHKKVEEICP